MVSVWRTSWYMKHLQGKNKFCLIRSTTIAMTKTARITLSMIRTSSWFAFSLIVIYFLGDSMTTMPGGIVSFVGTPVVWVFIAKELEGIMVDASFVLDNGLRGVEINIPSALVTECFLPVMVVVSVLGDFVWRLVGG